MRNIIYMVGLVALILALALLGPWPDSWYGPLLMLSALAYTIVFVVALVVTGDVASPVAVGEKRKAKYDAWKAKWDGQSRQRDLRDAALDAIRQIAAGHNDPRALALETLKKFGEGV